MRVHEEYAKEDIRQGLEDKTRKQDVRPELRIRGVRLHASTTTLTCG